jgi:hypothetical protein
MRVNRMMRFHHLESTNKAREAIHAADPDIQWNERTLLPERELPLVVASPQCNTCSIVCDEGQTEWMIQVERSPETRLHGPVPARIGPNAEPRHRIVTERRRQGAGKRWIIRAISPPDYGFRS